ncbi:MotA/TolQ/ExbB proton channel family protein [Xylophilus sp. GOD-11R]|uniref:MotA/TolQ/ExbB proton channel family protein n=1 Tax=Xylophilus sp. GOD-11R TaxID=3089814 RepID=UPI00298CD399|nr:MotA/TolQ/ExbB proton channel family protein [Xylophilus sp. GOD-11R]WPB57216.1 MotA/TolQ/ExbB proton channel family protein [Xylophilus sp. GOD-11R]
MDALSFFMAGDALARVVAVVLLVMSVSSWIVILWKSWLLNAASRHSVRAIAAFWQSPSLDDARQRLSAFDPQGLVTPFVAALAADEAIGLAAGGDRAQRRTRVLRDALHQASAQLQSGQVLLASIGAIAPFVGLLGTVWGIHRALVDIAGAGQISIERIAGPVGEALVMTAAGLAVAIPAVLAYNLLGRRIVRIEAELEGFAQDLRDL